MPTSPLTTATTEAKDLDVYFRMAARMVPVPDGRALGVRGSIRIPTSPMSSLNGDDLVLQVKRASWVPNGTFDKFWPKSGRFIPTLTADRLAWEDAYRALRAEGVRPFRVDLFPDSGGQRPGLVHIWYAESGEPSPSDSEYRAEFYYVDGNDLAIGPTLYHSAVSGDEWPDLHLMIDEVTYDAGTPLQVRGDEGRTARERERRAHGAVGDKS